MAQPVLRHSRPPASADLDPGPLGIIFRSRPEGKREGLIRMTWDGSRSQLAGLLGRQHGGLALAELLARCLQEQRAAGSVSV